MTEAQQNVEHLKILMRYIDYYSDPLMVLKSVPDGTTIGEVRESLIEAFHQVRLQLAIVQNVELLTTNEVLLAMNGQIKHSISGVEIENGICKYCKEPLIDYNILLEMKKKEPVQVSARRKKFNSLNFTETGKLSIVKFPHCGHSMHLKCITSHKNCLYDYVEELEEIIENEDKITT